MNKQMNVRCLHGESQNVRDRQREEEQQKICEEEIQAMLWHPSTLAEPGSLLKRDITNGLATMR